jgi:hypothetical protein
MRLKRALSISEQKSTNECLGEADLVSSAARMISLNGQEENSLSASFLERSHCPTSLTSFQSTVTQLVAKHFFFAFVSRPALVSACPACPLVPPRFCCPSLGSCLWKVIGTSHEPHEIQHLRSPAGSRSTRTRRQSQHKSDEPKVVSFVFLQKRPQRLLVETGLLGMCSYFVPARSGAISAKTLAIQ